MKDFIYAALPWVLSGLAVIVICTGMDKKKSKEEEKRMEYHSAAGLALGLLFGIILNGCGLWENQALGYAVGPLWGMAAAALWDNNSSKKDEGDE